MGCMGVLLYMTPNAIFDLLKGGYKPKEGGLGFRTEDLGFRVWSLGFRV